MTAMFFMGQASGFQWSALDGSLAASGGPAQLPSQTSGYTRRAPWSIAGVDYAIGIRSNVTLADPVPGGTLAAALVAMGGALGTVGGYPTITFSGSGSITIGGYDFSLHGGYSLSFLKGGGSQYTSITVQDCKFNSGSTSGVISTDALLTSLAMTVQYCTYDQTGGPFYQGSEFVYLKSSGSLTFQYNYLNNFSSGGVAVIGANTLNYKYNLLVNGARYPGEHMNMLEYAGNSVTCTGTVTFNTVVSHPQGGPSGEVFQFYNNSSGSTLSNPECGNNTIIADLSTAGIAARQNNHAYNLGDLITVPGGLCTSYKCYTAGTSAGSQPGAYASTGENTGITDGTAVFQGTSHSGSNLLHGSYGYERVAIQGIVDNGSGFCRVTTDASGVLATGNVCIIDGVVSTIPNINGTCTITQINTSTYDLNVPFSGSYTSGGELSLKTVLSGSATVHDNYFDITGTAGIGGAFYVNTGGVASFLGWTASNNIDMSNGKTINTDNSEV